MAFPEAKVYSDGSHFIAIPHTTRPIKRRPKRIEEEITIVDENIEKDSDNITEPSISHDNICNVDDSLIPITDEETLKEIEELFGKTETKQRKNVKKTTKKELFNELYAKYIDLKKNERKKQILKEMLPYFEKEEYCKAFVENNFERKQRNLICRRVRMCRKANLAGFNYFCTFTYDDKKHTEFTFKKKLKTTLRNLCYRKNWKYMGVWERAPETNRLHFHGLFNIPNGSMVGELEEHKDYSFSEHKRIMTYQNSYFNDRFGRSDFKEINTHSDLTNEIRYLIKYIEKTGEKIVYSKGLPQYFISDILDEDIVCTIGQEDKKLLLFDDFMCLDEGEPKGRVSPEVIEQMRKCNN